MNFLDNFGIRLFRDSADDLVAICDLVKTCKYQTNFVLKIQALSVMIDRMNTKELKILIRIRNLPNGSINALEQFLKENYSKISRHIIKNLRNLMSLRNKMYPAHATASVLLAYLRNFGKDKYPLEDWETSFSKILNLVTNSMVDLNGLILNKNKKL